MKKRIYISFVIVLLLNSNVFSQFIGKDDLSISLFYFQKSKLDSAKKYIDKAALNEEFRGRAKGWYYKGIIYKDIYKRREKANKMSPSRLISIDAFKKSIDLDTLNEYKENNTKSLYYLGSTLYNDAARLLNDADYEKAQINYQLFREVILEVDSTTDIKTKDISFKMAMASMYNRPKPGKEALDSFQINKVKSIYEEVLKEAPEHPGANYNLAILYYNERS